MRRLIPDVRGMEKRIMNRRHTPEPNTTRVSAHVRKPAHPSILSPGAGPMKIGFVGMSAGAGTTTIAFAAAEYLASFSKEIYKGRNAKRIAMLELSPSLRASAGSVYDKIGADKRFAGREFLSFYRYAREGKPLMNLYNIDGGVNWVLRIPGEPASNIPATVHHRLLNNIPADIVLADISAQSFLNEKNAPANDEAGSLSFSGMETLGGLLADLNRIICIIDPLPSRLLAGVPVMECVRAAADAGVHVTYALNKLNPGVNLRETLRFTGIREYASFPAVKAETVYASEYACHSLTSDPEIKNALAAIFGP